jgi:hypothetical protein
MLKKTINEFALHSSLPRETQRLDPVVGTG